MPASAVQTKKWYRPNGWFTDRELSIVVNRVLRDDPSKGVFGPKVTFVVTDDSQVTCITARQSRLGGCGER
jgi:hypothetical protein